MMRILSLSTFLIRLMHITHQHADLLRSSVMGSEIVVVTGGNNQVTIHKGLLCTSAPSIANMIAVTSETEQKLALPDVDPAVLKLFAECLYTRCVPRVSSSTNPATQCIRLRHLIQLYAFAEKYHVAFKVRNKIMDAIQDGFNHMKKFPEAALVTAIYKNTGPNSVSYLT